MGAIWVASRLRPPRRAIIAPRSEPVPPDWKGDFAGAFAACALGHPAPAHGRPEASIMRLRRGSSVYLARGYVRQEAPLRFTNEPLAGVSSKSGSCASTVIMRSGYLALMPRSERRTRTSVTNGRHAASVPNFLSGCRRHRRVVSEWSDSTRRPPDCVKRGRRAPCRGLCAASCSSNVDNTRFPRAVLRR
jgi:hypothetical protein